MFTLTAANAEKLQQKEKTLAMCKASYVIIWCAKYQSHRGRGNFCPIQGSNQLMELDSWDLRGYRMGKILF